MTVFGSLGGIFWWVFVEQKRWIATPLRGSQ
jgi:hypothetical protein